MTNIEPTEEQYESAHDLLQHGSLGNYENDICRLAQWVAEREAKLREGLARIIEAVHVQMAATALPQPLIDVVRGVYAEHPYALHRIEDLETVCHALQDERDTLRARVAELEARPQFASVSSDGFIATSTGPVHVDDVGSVQDALEKRVAELEEIAADLRGDIESDVEKHKREVEVLTKRVAELEASLTTFHTAWKGAERDYNAQVKCVAELEHLLGRWCAAEVMCDVSERRKLLDETGSMLLAKKAGV